MFNRCGWKLAILPTISNKEDRVHNNKPDIAVIVQSVLWRLQTVK